MSQSLSHFLLRFKLVMDLCEKFFYLIHSAVSLVLLLIHLVKHHASIFLGFLSESPLQVLKASVKTSGDGSHKSLELVGLLHLVSDLRPDQEDLVEWQGLSLEEGHGVDVRGVDHVQVATSRVVVEAGIVHHLFITLTDDGDQEVEHDD
jgi:hypothetical protein